MANPAPWPYTCARCGHQHQTRCNQHTHFGRYCDCPAPEPPMLPEPHEIAAATVVTEWTCPYCNTQQDVWGEGAILHWMECGHCGKPAFLSDAEPGDQR